MHLEEQEDAGGRFVNAKKNENQQTEAAKGDESPAAVNLSVGTNTNLLSQKLQPSISKGTSIPGM